MTQTTNTKGFTDLYKVWGSGAARVELRVGAAPARCHGGAGSHGRRSQRVCPRGQSDRRGLWQAAAAGGIAVVHPGALVERLPATPAGCCRAMPCPPSGHTKWLPPRQPCQPLARAASHREPVPPRSSPANQVPGRAGGHSSLVCFCVNQAGWLLKRDAPLPGCYSAPRLNIFSPG